MQLSTDFQITKTKPRIAKSVQHHHQQLPLFIDLKTLKGSNTKTNERNKDACDHHHREKTTENQRSPIGDVSLCLTSIEDTKRVSTIAYDRKRRRRNHHIFERSIKCWRVLNGWMFEKSIKCWRVLNECPHVIRTLTYIFLTYLLPCTFHL